MEEQPGPFGKRRGFGKRIGAVGLCLRRGCRGIVTTHYTALKEFAYAEEGIENASMEFDGTTLRPLYRLRAVRCALPGAGHRP